jgi:triosephosphate isomerase
MKKLLLLNWKHHWIEDIESFIKLVERSWEKDITFLLAPPHPLLALLMQRISKQIVAQNVHNVPLGSYTGAVGAAYLAKLGVQYALLGHKEVRQQSVKDEDIVLAYQACLHYGIKPILCCGAAEINDVEKSLQAQLNFLNDCPAASVMIAYEPYWAIGKEGLSQNFNHIQSVYDFILSLLPRGTVLNFFYGGGLDVMSCGDLIKKPFISGLLLGKAGLNIDCLTHILNAAE